LQPTHTFEHGFITANRAGDTSVAILAGVNIAEGSLVVTGTNPPILGIDNDGTAAPPHTST
jgi:hypothetical protein